MEGAEVLSLLWRLISGAHKARPQRSEPTGGRAQRHRNRRKCGRVDVEAITMHFHGLRRQLVTGIDHVGSKVKS